MKKKILVIFGFFLIFSACSLSKETSFKPENSKQIAEALLPQDVTFLMKFQTTDDEEFQNLQILKKVFIDDEIEENLKNDFLENVNGDLAMYDLSYEEDIKPVLGDRVDFVVAGKNLSAYYLAELENGEIPNADFYFVQKLNDLEKYNALMAKLVEEKVIFEIEGGYEFSLQDDQILYFTEKNGYFVLTNTSDEFVHLLTLEVADSLIYNEKYVEVREGLPPVFTALFYMDMEEFFKIFALTDEQKSELKTDDLQDLENSYLKVWSAMGTSMNIESDGLNIKSYGIGNKEAMKSLDFKFNLTPNKELVLDKKLPGKDLWFYIEDFDIKTGIDRLKTDFAKTTDQGVYQKWKAQLKLMTGLDLEKDVLSWMDRSVVMSVQKTDAILPGLTFAFDVASNPEGAGKFLDTLDSLLSIVLLSSPEYKPAIQQEEKTLGESIFKEISIIPEELPLELQEQGEMIVSVLSDFKLIYGVTDDNVMLLTTYPNFLDDYKKETAMQNRDYKQLTEKVETKGQGLVYFSPNILGDYVNQVLDFLEENGEIVEEDRVEWSKVSDVLNHFVGAMFVGNSQEYSIEGQAYIKID